MASETKRKIIQGGGLLVLAALFIIWCVGNEPSNAGFASALVCTCLFAAVCLRFVPVWLKSWSGEEKLTVPTEESSFITAKLFLAVLLWDAVLIVLVTAVRTLAGEATPLDFWRCTDSRHYLDIAEDWYLSEGSIDRLVQLVFLPGYPLAVRLAHLVTGNYVVAGMLVSALCFAAAVCVFYKLLRLDMDSETAVRAVVFLCLFPGAFFFAAPMSESLFLLLSLCCIYSARKDKFLAACVFGGLAAFTRSVGLALIVPVLFELIAQREKAKNYIWLLLIPLGFAAYCGINYAVSGDAFKFMEYQREHWNQSFGFFWNTAAYQTDYAIGTFSSDVRSFLGLWLPNLIALFASAAIMLAGVKKLRASYSAYFIAYYFVAMGATWLLSAPRYMLVMFPICASLAFLTEKRAVRVLAYALCLAAGLCYLAVFALRWQVW